MEIYLEITNLKFYKFKLHQENVEDSALGRVEHAFQWLYYKPTSSRVMALVQYPTGLDRQHPASMLRKLHLVLIQSPNPRRDLYLCSTPVHMWNAISPSNTLLSSAIFPNIININLSEPKLPPCSLSLLNSS